jgi:16S rRNA (cytosine1402-N4)-methyltransferase
MTKKLHHSVLLQQAVQCLSVQPSGVYVDGTYGRGGHTQAILDHLGEDGQLIAIDKDPVACEHAQQQFGDDKRFSIHHGAFTCLSELTKEKNVFGSVNGILFDLGLSSPHLDEPSRGFSFMHDGPLDMRMDTTKGLTAAQWLSEVSQQELETILRNYGEERYARRIAKAIIRERDAQSVDSTNKLASVIAMASPVKDRHKHPATRSFQAIRIFINQELEELQATLEQTLDVLAVGGRLVVISFHSLEDRIVKRFINRHTQGENLPRGLPLIEEKICQRLQKINGAIRPSADEISQNPRARSAVLRVVEKIS